MTPTRRPGGKVGPSPRDRLVVHAPRLLVMDEEQQMRAVAALTALLIPVAREHLAADLDSLDRVGDIEQSWDA